MYLFSFSVLGSNKLVVVGEEFPPYKFIEKGNLIGIDVEIISNILKRLDINFEVLSCPWKRCWKMLQDGEADLGLSVSNKLDRKKYVYFPENSVWSADFYFFATKETKEKYHLSSIEDARKNKLKVGIVRGNSYHESFWKVFPRDENNYNNQLSPTANALMNFRKLSKGRIDLFPIPKTIGLFTI
ncbi:transporter substrate-binding domain-containing protein [Halobacteriovorax sp. JY17]|uniref:substrate-binding periplasmic protein n=1 Tax=Halobacteriovorax sp. JY17 TaxID=2014617 RepID=UPI0025BD0B41|nr:transporter substrate-binding domain-containing protein [Halobacteriovorax sp. JY17]